MPVRIVGPAWAASLDGWPRAWRLDASVTPSVVVRGVVLLHKVRVRFNVTNCKAKAICQAITSTHITCAREYVGLAAQERGVMVTYILMTLAVAAVALLAGFTGGLPGPPHRPTESNGTTPAPEHEFQSAGAGGMVNMRLPKTSRPDRIIRAMACAMVVLIGALGMLTLRLTTCGGDQLRIQGAVGSSLADRVVGRLLRSAPGMQAQSDTSLFDNHNSRAAMAQVATVAISEPPSHAAHEIRAMRKSAVGVRIMATVVKGLVIRPDRGTWLYSPYANGGG